MGNTKFSLAIKNSIHGDEWYTPQKAVDMIVPHVLRAEHKNIWCPFDTSESLYVKTFQSLGLNVKYGHIDTGQDFFSYEYPQGDIVVSNPPFSKRDAILERLYEMGIPFALIMNWNGLFDSKKRTRLFSENGVEFLIPYGRMRFAHRDHGKLNSPLVQSVYLCHKLLGKQIVVSDYSFYKEGVSDR